MADPTPEERAALIGPCLRLDAEENPCACRPDKSLPPCIGGVRCAMVIAAIREAENAALERAAILSKDMIGATRHQIAAAIRELKR